MVMRSILGEALGAIVGGIAIAALFCWLCWHAFKYLRHPELGVPVGLMIVIMAWHQSIGHSELLKMAIFFSAMTAVGLWPAGMDWRHHVADAHPNPGTKQ